MQGTWNYERMLGVGMGYAAEPLLEELKLSDPQRHAEAVVRSAEFFNCNPNLAGLALGAEVRAEYDAAPGAQVARLRTALCSPLGALGDQLFWAGLVPALVGLTLAAVTLGAGLWAIVGFLLVYNGVRIWTAVWSLRTGLAAGMNVARGDREVVGAQGRRRGCAGSRVRGRGWRCRLWPPGILRPFPLTAGARRAWAYRARARRRLCRRRALWRAAVRARAPSLLTLLVRAGARVTMPELEREATIVNSLGMHARPAAQFVRLASSFASDILVSKDGIDVNGKSIMGVMMLAAECGSAIRIKATGDDAERAVDALAKLVADGFGET